MSPRRKLRQSLLLCAIAVGAGAYDRYVESDSAVEIQPVEERVATRPGRQVQPTSRIGSASDEVDEQAEEILAF